MSQAALDKLDAIQVRLAGRFSTPKWLKEDLAVLRAEIEEVMMAPPPDDPSPPADINLDDILKTYRGEGANNLTYAEGIAVHSFLMMFGKFADWDHSTPKDQVKERMERMAEWAHMSSSVMKKETGP